MGKIPEGWLPYAPIGNQVPGTRFIAFKVPLREAFVDKLQADDRFTIGVLLDRIPDLGLVIDLTHTTKYYNKREFLDRGVDYVKIQTPGQIVPPQHLVERFFEVVDYYLDSHKNDNSLIGVHCTHGVNRTGYMLCRYLIQRLGYTFNEAVEAVGRARGHLIERSPYLASLEEIKPPEPKRPIMRANGAKKAGKKEDAGKKDEPRRNMGKDGFRGDYRTSPGRVSMVPGRPAPRVRSRTPPPQQHPRGRDSPVPVVGRTSPLQPIRSRRSPPHYDRPMTGQPRGSQQAIIRDRMAPSMSHGRTPPPQPRGRTPPHSFRSRTPPPPSLHLSHHSPPGHMRGRSPPPVIRNRTSPTMIRRSPPRPQGRGRSPPPDLINRRPPISSRGRSPPSHMRGRSPPPNMRAISPPVHIRSRSPPDRGMRRRTPTHYGRVPSPSHEHIPVPIPPSPPGHGRMSRREQIPHGRGRSQPPGRGRSPPRRERTPPIQSSRRPSSPDYRRNEPHPERHYSTRPSYEDGGRRVPEESARDYNDRFPPSNQQYSNDRSYGPSAEYYPERYEKIRRERSVSPRRNYSYYPYQRDELPVRAEYSPPRETKRRRKTPPPSEVREKMRRSTPPSGYMNSRDGRESFKKEKREYPSVPWDVKEKDPDCREILNEKRSMRDVYPDAGYPDVPKYAPVNADLREALEEEKRRRHSDTGYHGQDLPLEDRNVMRQGYTHEYPYRSESEMVRGRSRQDYPGGSSNHDSGVRPDGQRHHGYQDSAPYPEPKHHRSQGEYGKSRDDDFRKSRGRRTKRVFDRLSRGGRGRGGGYWP